MNIELICPNCNFTKKIPEERIPAGIKWATCPRCSMRFEFIRSGRKTVLPAEGMGTESSFGREGDESKKESGRRGAPWERRAEIGFWQGIYQTLKSVLFSPVKFFGSLTFKGGIRDPLAFGILIGAAGSMLSYFWAFLMFSGGVAILLQPFIGHIAVSLIFLAMMAFIPVLIILWLFFSSGVLHLLLLVVGGGKNGFEATFRVILYSQAARVWGLVPFFGGWIGWLWRLIIQIIGLREIHETSYLRVIIAFAIPVVLIFLLLLGIFIPLTLFLFQR